MDRSEIRWLLASAALAAGEGSAALLPTAASCWPALLIVAVLIVLLGFGFAWRFWPFAALALAGAILFSLERVETERRYRETPWLKDAAAHRAQRLGRTSVLRDLSRRVGIGLGHDRLSVRLNRAILLGEREGIPRRTKRVFVEAGTVHIFAISGLHVLIVSKVLMVLVALTFLPYRVQGLVAIVPVWCYVLVIGSPPSAVRAALMASMAFLSPLFLRRSNGIVAWAQAFLVSHLLFPHLISNVGSQLSYAVMLSILVTGRICSGGFAVTLAAWAAGVPIAAMVFGRITLGALLANLVLLAVAAHSVVAGVVGILLSYLSEPLAVHLNNLSALMTEAMVGISTAVAALPGSHFEIEPWTADLCVFWYVAFAFTLYLAARVRARRNLV